MAPSLLAVNNYYYLRGGSESVFFSEIEQLQDAGWHVVPFSMHHPENRESQWSEHFVEEIELGNISSITQKMKLAPKSVYSFEAKRKLRGLLSEFTPDVCHLHNIYHHLSPSFLSMLKQAGIPTVMTLHDLKLACPAYNMYSADGVCERCKGARFSNLLQRRCINNSLLMSGLVYLETQLHRLLKSYHANVDRFVVPSKFYRDKFIEWGVPADKLLYIPNAIDTRAFSPGESVGDYFLYVGRLVDQKGVHTLIRAAAEAGVKLKVVGTGPQSGSLQQLAAETSAQVEFTGYLSGDTLHDVIRSARAVVLPSEWYENAPISVLEAYALGVPVLGADIGGIPEMIEAGRTGSTFASGDKDALAERLREFAGKSDAELLKMGKCGREFVVAGFDKPAHLQHLLSLYAELGVAA